MGLLVVDGTERTYDGDESELLVVDGTERTYDGDESECRGGVQGFGDTRTVVERWS